MALSLLLASSSACASSARQQSSKENRRLCWCSLFFLFSLFGSGSKGFGQAFEISWQLFLSFLLPLQALLPIRSSMLPPCWKMGPKSLQQPAVQKENRWLLPLVEGQ
jgi:hypothetical protein